MSERTDKAPKEKKRTPQREIGKAKELHFELQNNERDTKMEAIRKPCG
jgi:hypothetical protein